MSPKKQKLWIKTPYTNLWKFVPSGNYYCKAKVRGHLVRKGLKTDDIQIAKTKLDTFLAEQRRTLPKHSAKSECSFSVLAQKWKSKISSDPDLKESSKRYRLETLKMIQGCEPQEVTTTVSRYCWLRDHFPGSAKGHKNPLPPEVKRVEITKQVGGIESLWPELNDMDVRKLTQHQLESFLDKLRRKYSASRFNGCLQTLRSVLELAIELGWIAESPLKEVKAAPIKNKKKHLPSDDKFRLLLKELASHPSRQPALLLVQLLAYSGRRIGSVRKLLPKHVNLDRNIISWPPIKYQDDYDDIPMSPQLRAVAQELLKQHPGDESPLVPIKDPKKALAKCCENLGMKKLTNHDFRHYFTTKALEQGVPVPDVALMRGDKDGGAMLLKTYFHSRIEHLTLVASKVKF